MNFQPNILLRRTFLPAAAILVAAVAFPTHAGGIKKSEDNAILCSSFATANVTPDGGISITGCTGTSAPSVGPAGTFNITSNGVPLPWNYSSANTFTVARTGGSTGPVTVNFKRTGGCGPLPLTDAATFTDGVTSANLPIKTPNNETTCKITLLSVTRNGDTTATADPVLGTSQSATVAGSSTATPPGSGGGGGGGAFNCPAKTADANGNLPILYGGGINGFLGLSSGQIGYGALPSFSSSGGAPQSPSGKIAMAITTNSPTSGTVDVSISHCPGVIDTTGQYAQGITGGKCYAQFPIDQSEHDIYWFEVPGSSLAATNALADQYAGFGISLCEAFASNGPWYITVKYNFPDGGVHNMAWQWQYAGFNP